MRNEEEMTRKKTNNNKKNKRKKKQRTPIGSTTEENDLTIVDHLNFVPEAGKGCHIVRHSNGDDDFTSNLLCSDSPEILGWELNIDKADYFEDNVDQTIEIPDICFDPDEDGLSSTLTLCNLSSDVTKVAYITIYVGNQVDCYGKDGKKFGTGLTVDNDGNQNQVITFIILSPPMSFCTLCEMILTNNNNNNDIGTTNEASFCYDDITQVRIESDVQAWKSHPDPSMECPVPIRGFPLECHPGSGVLCTQGMNGCLTHYFLGNLHAIDFRCDVGTPLLAVEDGVVMEVKQGNSLTGICASNLFTWNNILIRHDICTTTNNNNDDDEEETENDENNGYFYTEYVHIESAIVKEGDVVQKGDRIGYSGSVGFSPEPHLHFAVYLSRENDAPSVGFWFQGQKKIEDEEEKYNLNLYRPTAGKCYDAFGPISGN